MRKVEERIGKRAFATFFVKPEQAMKKSLYFSKQYGKMSEGIKLWKIQNLR